MYKLKTYTPYGLNERYADEAFWKFKIDHMFSIYNKVTRGSLVMNIFSSFLSSSYYLFMSSNFLLFKFYCHLLTIYLSLAIILLLLLLLFYYHCYNCFITTVILTNITGTVILEKSRGGEFQARNSSCMVYPYSSR